MKQMLLTPPQWLNLKRHALVVLLICYLPHITTQPIWLLLTLIAAIGYRVSADRFHFSPLPWWARLIIVLAFLFLLSSIPISSSFFISLLLTFVILKCLELNSIRDLKALILSNYLLIFSGLIVSQDLWMVVYLFVAVFANLSLMIKLSAPEVPLSQISSKSGQQLLIIIPLSVFLFYVFPRLDPLWRIPTTVKNSVSLDDKMTPGSISGMFGDESTAMQITFRLKPILRGYWRGIILSFYNGETWYPASSDAVKFQALPELDKMVVPDYEIVLEPTQRKFLYYEGFVISSQPALLFSPNYGLFRYSKAIITNRFAYAAQSTAAPYVPLSPAAYLQATQLPANTNPRLTAWTQSMYAKEKRDPQAFVTFLKNYIHEQPFWYSLTPPSLGFSNQQMDRFWFDNRKGFCEHYASAVTFILRTAGIPARVVVGYYGGKWNPITRTVTIQQNNAHSWLEYWLEGVGWQEFDPTSSVSITRIDNAIYNRDHAISVQSEYLSLDDVPWRQRISLMMDSLVFYSQRWFMFYNQHTQQHLLRNLGLGRLKADQLLQISVTAVPIIFILLGLYYQWRQRLRLDPLTIEYHALQQTFRTFNVTIKPSDTLKQQCELMAGQMSEFAPVLQKFIVEYERLRLMPDKEAGVDHKRETILLFRQLRNQLGKK